MKGTSAEYPPLDRCHPSGWFKSIYLLSDLNILSKRNLTKETLVLLILNGHYPYIYTRNLDVIDIAHKNYVIILSIPSYTIHKIQFLNHIFETHGVV